MLLDKTIIEKQKQKQKTLITAILRRKNDLRSEYKFSLNSSQNAPNSMTTQQTFLFVQNTILTISFLCMYICMYVCMYVSLLTSTLVVD